MSEPMVSKCIMDKCTFDIIRRSHCKVRCIRMGQRVCEHWARGSIGLPHKGSFGAHVEHIVSSWADCKMVMSFFPQHHWQVLFELILAANYLDIKSLLDLTCAKVASMIKGKNTEDMLGIRGVQAQWQCRCCCGAVTFIIQIDMDLA